MQASTKTQSKFSPKSSSPASVGFTTPFTDSDSWKLFKTSNRNGTKSTRRILTTRTRDWMCSSVIGDRTDLNLPVSFPFDSFSVCSRCIWRYDNFPYSST
uniref:Uncharacterized protein n=1 Tax=Cacopsylla melanoneura TaxID=428564 RepID=A0A8D8TAB4_9HEMI